jgi:hypothetical protein
MQTSRYTMAFVLSGLMFVTASCSKKEESAPPSPASSGQAAQKAKAATSAVAQEMQKVAETAKGVATQVQQTVREPGNTAKAVVDKAAADATATNTTAKGQNLIDTATRLVAEQRWGEVLRTVTQLKDVTLTPDQELSLSNLLQQLQKMVKGDAPGGPLPKK